MSKATTRLPMRLLAQIGRIATLSAEIEQAIILWASALYSQDTSGLPIEPLRMEFGRLRRTWYAAAAKRLDRHLVDTVIHPINTELARLWVIRGNFLHGRWRAAGRWQFQLEQFEQKKTLRHRTVDFSLSEIRGAADDFQRALRSIHRYAERASPSASR